jgi:transposase
MIPRELRARIRRLFYAEHWRVGTIAAELGIHHQAVEHAIESERFVHPGALVRPSMLDPFKSLVTETLEQYPRLRATRLYEMLRARGFEGSAVQLRRYVRKVRPAVGAEAFLRLETLPGEEGQVDWGNFGHVRAGAATRTLSCFVLVLSWSRGMYARFGFDQTLESFLRGHVYAFAALGGVPRQVLYDNLKSVVLERDGDHIRFHPRILDLAAHYHFAPKPCAPYRGNEKGKVERTIQYLRHSFYAARRWTSLDDLNAQLAGWIERVAHARPLPGAPASAGRHVQDAVDDERPRLLPLPEHPFECDVVKPVASGKTPYVRFDGNDYSIPDELVRRPLTLVAGETTVRVLDGTAEVARHVRSYDRGQRVEDAAHLAALARKKRRARELRGRDFLRQSCPHAGAFLEALATRGEPLAANTARLRQLLDRYDAAALDQALEEALARGALSAASVAHVLDQRARARRAPPPLDVVLPDDPRIRDLRLTPHALASYDALCTDPKPKAPNQEKDR